MDLQIGDPATADVAAVSPGQPGVRLPGDGSGPPASRRARRLAGALVALLAAAAAVSIAHDAGVVGKAAIPPLVHVVVATLVFVAVGGFGLTRLLLPAGLRRH